MRWRDALRRFDGILVGGQALSRRTLRERAEQLGGTDRQHLRVERDGGRMRLRRRADRHDRRARGRRDCSRSAGPMLAEGYLGDPERTAAAFHEADGARWYRTGDLGERVDATGA